ncbi:odorant receptor Or2-like isoform X4 [Cylas formicarius]|nr:odorant receptor Or2-like isoform X4 [Cylas formicarius]XP_060524865.1 odorant receptor Or2-like isoform X4 [Cylas formicarius]
MSRLIFVSLLIIKVGICQTKKVMELLRRSQLEEDEIICQADYLISEIYKMHALYGFKLNLALSLTAVLTAVTLCIVGIQASYQFYRQYININDTSETMDIPQMLPLWYPIIDRNKRHMLVMSHQIVQTLLTSLFTSVVQTFTNSILIFLRARLQILRIRFVNFSSVQVGETSNNEDEIPLRTLKHLCAYHQQLITSVEELNDSLKYILLLECSVTSILLAALLTQILWRRYVAFNVAHFFLVVFQIMALSWNSNEIADQSSQLSNALYESNWYVHSRKCKLLLLMMMRSQKPLVLTVGPLGPMTTQVGLSIVRLAYSYFSVMSS